MRRFSFYIAGSIIAVAVSCLLRCSHPSSGLDEGSTCDKTENGYFDVYYPESGQSLKMGSRDSIVWSNRSFPKIPTVSVYLFKGMRLVDTILSAVPNSGIAVWTIPRVTAAEDYLVRVQSAADTSRFDNSCSFGIATGCSGSFTFTSPGAGAACTSGSSLQILWQSIGAPGDSVSLEMYKDSMPLAVITDKAGNNGAYAWTIPAGMGTYRIKITSFFDLEISAVSPAFKIVDPETDAYEPDDCPDSASMLDSLGKLYYHSVPKNDVDWVKFLADSAAVYGIRIGGVGTAALYYGKDTAFIQTLLADSNADSAIHWACPKTGAYYVKFSSSADTTEYYSFMVTKVDSLKLLVFFAPTASTVWNAGSSSIIRWSPTSSVLGKNANIYLFKGPLRIAAIASGAANSGSFLFTIDPSLESDSDYCIKLVNAADTGLGGVSELFTIWGCDADSFEPDDGREKASKLTVNSRAQNRTLPKGDTDWVAFGADSGKTYRFLSSVSFPVAVKLLCNADSAPSFDSIWPATGVNAVSFQWICPKSGSWHAEITAASAGSGCNAYSLEIAEMDSIIAAAISASILSPAQGAIWAWRSTQQIRWTPDTVLLGQYVFLYLYKGSQMVQSICSDPLSNKGLYTWTIPSALAIGADYRIRIVDYADTSRGGFSLPFIINSIMPDPYEPDSVREAASILNPVGTPQSHTLSVGDTDWVKFTLDSGQAYLLQSRGSLGTRVDLFYGSDASYTASFHSSSSDTAASLKWLSPKSGIWYARISAYYADSSSIGTYSFSIHLYDSLAMVSFLFPTAGSTLETGKSYRIQWIPDTALLGTIISFYLYKGNKLIQNFEKNQNSGYFDWTLCQGIPSSVDYHLKMVNNSFQTLGGFSPFFTINGCTDAFEPDDSISCASSIATDSTLQGRCLALGDIDWISFTAQKDSIYVIGIVIDHYADLMEIHLYNSSGLSFPVSKFWTCPLTDTYYIKISGPNRPNDCIFSHYSIAIKKYSQDAIFKFITPTAQSVWAAESTYSIQYVANPMFFNFPSYPKPLFDNPGIILELFKDTTYMMGFGITMAGQSSYPWSIPYGLPTGNNYFIRYNSRLQPISGCSPAFTITGIDPDNYEPDDSNFTAHSIATSGTPESHTIPLLDQDWFSFSAAANNLYMIKTTKTGSIPTKIDLYGTDGMTLINTSNWSNSLVMVCLETGNYYFKISGYIVPRGVVFESSNPILWDAYTVSVDSYDSTKFGLTVTSPAAGDSLTAGQSVLINWSGQTPVGGNVDIFLFNNSGQSRNIVEGATNSGTYTWTVPSTIAAGNDYYVKVISSVSSSINGSSGVFTIK